MPHHSHAKRLVYMGASLTLVLQPNAARALDCAKAASDVEKAICGDAATKKADEAMAKAYFAVLASTTDRAERDALIASQRTWLKARAIQGGEDFAESDGDLAGLLRRQTKVRMDALQRRIDGAPAFITNMRRQTALLKAHPGRLAGFSAECFIEPPHYGSGSYACMPVIALQRGDRLCRTETDWASGHMTEVWTVARVGADDTKLLATCKEGYATGPECPRGATSGDEYVGWTRSPGLATPDASQLEKALKPLDPEVDAKLDDRMKVCLSEAEYPPPNDYATETAETPRRAR